MKILTIDFETFYSQAYSLTKLTTEEYVRGDEFEVIGVAVQQDDGEPVWFSGTRKETKEFLQQFDFENNIALAHNAMFDGAILGWYFGINPKGWLDTLCMARALHGTEVGGSLKVLAEKYQLGVKGDEVIAALGKKRDGFNADSLAKYGEYCRNDVSLTYKLFNSMADDFPKSELRLIDLTIKMYSEPVLFLDGEKLGVYKTELEEAKARLMEGLGVERETLQSNPQFAELLTSLGVLPPKKTSLTTGKETLAFAKNDEEFKALLEHEDPRVQALVAARLGIKSTLEEARTQRFMDIASRGAMPVPLRYYAAHTGRWGGDDKINLQNLPRNAKLKFMILPPEGHAMIDSDSSQIEARTLAWLAQQDDLVEAFDKGEDVYKKMASAIYSKPESEIVKSERFVGKTTILGCGYGMGAAKFQAQLKAYGVELSEEECKRIVSVYRQTYPHIPALWAQANTALKAIMRNVTAPIGRPGAVVVMGKQGIVLPNGLAIKYPNLREHTDQDSGKTELVYDVKKGKTFIPNRIYGGKVVENVCQALARIVIGEQMLQVAKKYRVVMTVHDAIACIAPHEELDVAKAYVEACMRSRPAWAPDLPLDCETGYGESYGDC